MNTKSAKWLVVEIKKSKKAVSKWPEWRRRQIKLLNKQPGGEV